jgi:hypothetical protein
MFRKIAEWLTGRKRSNGTHPLEYIDNRQERKEAEKAPVTQLDFVIPPLPEMPTAADTVQKPKEETKVEQATVESPSANTSSEPWPFPKSVPEVKEEVKPKKPRKPRTKKVV